MAVRADPYITISRALITLFLIGGAIFSVNLAYLLFIKGIGQGNDQLAIDIWGVSISPGSIGTAFLAIAIVFVVAAVKSKPVFSYKSQEKGAKARNQGVAGQAPMSKWHLLIQGPRYSHQSSIVRALGRGGLQPSL